MIDSAALAHFIGSQGWSFYGVVFYDEAQKALDCHRAVFKRWVESGYHASMDYLPRMEECRYNLRSKLPDVRSAVALVAWYANSNSGFDGRPVGGPMHEEINLDIQNSPTGSLIGSPTDSPMGSVARYARGRDYHKVLRKRLIALSDWIKEQARVESNSLPSERLGRARKCENYVSVDSGPMVDRVLAEAAGLGFFGKNSCLIDPSRGSFFFIASLLTTLELEPTAKKPMPNCGDCSKCQDICPTGALRGGGVIDANRCISYLTIENKGAIPVDLRPKIGNRLFGCDACQEVCPFNVGRAHHQEVKINDLKSDCGAGGSLDLAELLSIRTDEEFLKRFAGTPLMRAKRFGLLRNACVVAGNSGDRTLIPALKRLIESESNEILKGHARWAIGQLSNLNE